MNDGTYTDEDLVRYAVQDVDRSTAAAVEDHLAANPRAAAYVARLRRVIEIMRIDETEAPRGAVARRAVAALREARTPAVLAWLRDAERIVAALVFDTRAEPVATGFRGSEDGFQLAYEGDGTRLDLQAVPVAASGGERWRLRGRVRPHRTDEPDEVFLVAVGSSESVTTTACDEHGGFRIDSDPGVYDLVVRRGDAALVASDVDIG